MYHLLWRAYLIYISVAAALFIRGRPSAFFLARWVCVCSFFINSYLQRQIHSYLTLCPNKQSDFCELDDFQRLTDYIQTKLITLNCEHAIEYGSVARMFKCGHVHIHR